MTPKPNPKTKKTTPKKHKISIRKKLKKIDGMEAGIWLILTIIYVIFVSILSGWIKESFPDVAHLGSLPLDLQTGVWVLGVAMWLPISMILKIEFERD